MFVGFAGAGFVQFILILLMFIVDQLGVGALHKVTLHVGDNVPVEGIPPQF